MDMPDTAVNTADSVGRAAGNKDRMAVPDTGSYCHTSKGRILANTAGTGFRPSTNKGRRPVRCRCG